jgi:hypothetical protein
LQLALIDQLADHAVAATPAVGKLSDGISALSTRAFEAAKDFARCAVILPTGHRAVMRWGAVITVLPHGVHAIFASRQSKGVL